MREEITTRIAALCPAEGWFRLGHEEDGTIWISPIPCWVAVEIRGDKGTENEEIYTASIEDGAILFMPDEHGRLAHRLELRGIIVQMGGGICPQCPVDLKALGIDDLVAKVL
ncbi:MAG: hypothetical protein ACO1SV_27560 [Fimbriimonas sp.]